MSFGKKGVSGTASFGGQPVAKRVIAPPLQSPSIKTTVWSPPAPTPTLSPALSSDAADLPAAPPLASGLLMVLAVAFVAERLWGIGDPTWNPAIPTLVALGGLAQPLVIQNGEWWRLISAIFLHGDPLHLLFNGIALYIAGRVLEELIGRVWFLALFFIGGLAGSLMSLAVNLPNIVSVGASGAIMGLFAASTICSFRWPPSAARTRIQVNLLKLLIPAMLPLAVVAKGHSVDVAAHCGGALGGILTGMLILKTWPQEDPLPRFRSAAAGLAAAGILGTVLALGAVMWGYRGHAKDYAVDTALMPNDLVRQPGTLSREQAVDLVKRYPHDPRAHLYYATILLTAKEAAGAEAQLRQGLAETEILATKFPPTLEHRIRALLASTLAVHDIAEAKVIARPLCAGKAGVERAVITGLRLCD